MGTTAKNGAFIMKHAMLLGAAGACALVFLAALPIRAEDPWADAVLDYSPVQPVNAGFDTPLRALGPPVGAGPITPGNSSLVCLGVQGGSITLKFNTPVADDPENPMGLDCIVFGNVSFSGGDPTVKWQEPALIEISEDVNGNGVADDPWYLIPGSKVFRYMPPPDHTEPAGETNASDPTNIMAGIVENPNVLDADPDNDDQEYFWGYAELTPTMRKYLDNYVRPDDPFSVGITPRSGGGDAFDIAWAVDENGDPANIRQFHFIRLRAFIYRDCATLFYATPEIDAVADVAPDVDTDGDGILDEYETRGAGTDPTRPENTVLPLEIPPEEGGSPSGTFLGAAEDVNGNRIAFYAAGPRTDSGRALDSIVDIVERPDPGGSLPPGWLKTGAVREFVSSVSDFVAAGIQPARITIAYTPDEIAGFDEQFLTPFRFAGDAYVQEGIANVLADPFGNRVSFTSAQAGVFVLASKPGSGDQPLPGPGPFGLFVVMVLVFAYSLRASRTVHRARHV
jgi:hypothetical protein